MRLRGYRAGRGAWLVICTVALLGRAAAAETPPKPDLPKTDPSNAVIIGRSVKSDVSPPLRSIPPLPPKPWTTVREMHEPSETEGWNGPQQPFVRDGALQDSFGPSATTGSLSAPIQNFAGVNNIDGVYPPDTNGDVGPNHYVQWVNKHFQIFDKQGASLYGPAAGNSLWSGFGAPCEFRNDGDPIALYDPIADRWLMSQLTSASPYGQCIAISTTPDPTGSYYRYFFQLSTTTFYDYPKLGVWTDAYYMSANRGSVAAIAFERDKMLQGQPARYLEFDVSTSYAGTMLPSDLDGRALPPSGEPDFFANRAGNNNIDIYKFHVDWNDTASSTFTGPTSLATATYNWLCPSTRGCVPQAGTSRRLDGIGDRLMYRLAYRNFGDHESLVLNHAADVGGGQAGVRWYEIRDPNGSPAIYQQGTYAPDATSRWMASIAMDSSGDIAVGYSVSSSSIYPSIHYTGRLASDALGQMTQGEMTIINGSGAQTGVASRWGDYAMMAVDPGDDCTFWFTTEYMPSTSAASWQTRIASFKFQNCSPCTGVVCHPLDQCHDTGVCEPSTGLCSNPARNNGAACNDGNACTTNDACSSGVCTGGAALNCDDSNLCTADTCDSLSGCKHTFQDADNDGRCDAQDCAPNDASAFARPAEVGNLRLAADRVTLAWDSAAPAAGSGTVHDVVRGDMRQLPAGTGPETCLASGIAGTTTTDPATPASGEGYRYLVRGRNVCGAGTYGFQSNGTERASAACP
ncbi:MAG: hypothetical protein DMF49_05520 [Acidobacteria bacterium]|nr:MAG: hypothetical protein DMF49_05520 [Acidobacteriota bacterium]